MKMLMKANVYWNGHIKIFIKCIHCWLLKCLIHLEWSDIGLLQTTYPPCICPTQVIALILAPPLPRLTCIVVWPILIYHNFSCIMHSYIAVMKRYRLEQLAYVSWKVSGITDYSQASLTTMETSARMLCVILAYAYGVH